jgi:hypothetical protein
MTQLNVLDATGSDRSGYKVDVNRGERIGRVSSEWFSRPADERYLSLSELHDAVHSRAERSRSRTAESAIRVEASRDDAERLALMLPGGEVPLVPTHWSFGQLTTMIGAPSMYLRQLPAPLAAINLQYGLTSHRAELIKTLEVEEGRVELRAVTGPDYGRIYDHELVAAVQRIAGNGTGDTRWKVPGVLDWATGIYNPRVDITKCTTTLYASDRDTAQVTENVYDSPTGRFLLIPQGTRLIGVYDSQVSFGQSRVLLVWTRLIMPNGRSIVLERQPGADSAGYAGLEDEVDNHWGVLFKAALLSTLLGVGSELGAGSSIGNNGDIIQALRRGSSDSLNQTGQKVAQRNLNIQPTLTIRPGFPVRVIVNRDLVLEPYKG